MCNRCYKYDFVNIAMTCPACSFVLKDETYFNNSLKSKLPFSIVDAHTHIYPENIKGFWRASSSVESLIQAMDSAGVDQSMVIAIEPFISARKIYENISKYPDRLFLVGSVDPSSLNSEDFVVQVIKNYNARAIKLHPRLQKISFKNRNLIYPIAIKCEEFNVPLIMCSFCGGPDLFESKILEMCFELTIKFPNLKVIMAHAGAHRTIETMLALKSSQNLYIDLSFTPLYFKDSSIENDLKYLLKKTDPNKILFGSDFPEIPIDASIAWFLDVARDLNFSDEKINLILSGNSKKLFSLIK